jgi:hypothetical protein
MWIYLQTCSNNRTFIKTASFYKQNNYIIMMLMSNNAKITVDAANAIITVLSESVIQKTYRGGEQ